MYRDKNTQWWLFLLYACQTFIAISYHLFYIELWCLKSFVLQDSSFVSFYAKSSGLITQMEKQVENLEEHIKQILKAYKNHPLVFHKYVISNRDFKNIFMFCSWDGQFFVFLAMPWTSKSVTSG